jgi:hypothetical protein
MLVWLPKGGEMQRPSMDIHCKWCSCLVGALPCMLLDGVRAFLDVLLYEDSV